jgi:uncharacterized protein DUF3300
VETQGQTIVIEPANPEVVYVPTNDPWLVYGAPVVMWPGWYAYPGLYVPGPGVSFGLGFAVGFFAGFGWGWHHWGCDWHHRTVIYNHNTYISHSRTFVNRNGFHGGGFNHGGFHGGGPGPALHPSGRAHAQPGLHSGAFGDLITEASHIATRLVAARASVEVFTAEAAAADSSFVPQVKKKDGGSYAMENQIR